MGTSVTLVKVRRGLHPEGQTKRTAFCAPNACEFERAGRSGHAFFTLENLLRGFGVAGDGARDRDVRLILAQDMPHELAEP